MENETKTNRYIEAIGRRKTAAARVRITVDAKPSVSVNGKNVDAYFKTAEQRRVAIEAIAKAKNPVAYIGGGVILSNAAAQVLEFAEITKIPVTHTLMGIGGFPGTHPLSLGMLGMHGTYYANMAIHTSDLKAVVAFYGKTPPVESLPRLLRPVLFRREGKPLRRRKKPLTMSFWRNPEQTRFR